jgi:hypothetical protein
LNHRGFHLLAALLFLGVIALFGLAVMFLWNDLLPGIAGLPAINYWQATGLLILARILFGGMGGDITRGFHGHRSHFRSAWSGMREEERTAFMKKYGDGRCHDLRRPFMSDGPRGGHTEDTGAGEEPESKKS